jgi:curved DNA-binding protein CbpA
VVGTIANVTVDRYRDFVFNPVDLAEEVDLDVERRKEILHLEAHLSDWTHWQVLGIPWNASAEEARAAYREKVKVFHPDRYPGKRLGTFRPRLERIFRRLTEAKDLLSDEARRAAYAQKSAAPDEFARLESRRLQEEERAQERRARLARANPLVARASQVAGLLQRGKKAMADGRFAQAANDFLTASGLDARNAEAQELAQEAKKRAAKEKAKDAYDRGLAAEAVSNLPVALACFQEAAEADPGAPRYALQAARAALRSGDAAAARKLAVAAVDAGPRNAAAHELLGEILAAQGEKSEARRALEKALELDPQLESARASLKKLRWSFLG